MEDQRLITRFPVEKLWIEHKDIPNKRLRDIVRDDVEMLMAQGKVQLVVAQKSAPLLWLDPDEHIDTFWRHGKGCAYEKTITSHGQKPKVKKIPDYIFYPSEWEPIDGLSLVLLEMVSWSLDDYHLYVEHKGFHPN